MTEVVIPIQIDFRSGVPITNQIFEQIYDQVLRGDLKPGDQMPTVRSLAQQLKINFNTVARAYRLLDEAGIISTQHGRGTYILPVAVVYPGSNLKKLDSLTKNYLEQASELGVSSGEILAVFQRNLRNWDQPTHDQEEENQEGHNP
ncbi:MAG: GntR family transcriptional regulator [Anaerolineaceae bacterium]|nr:GntR family transcriptional regulator [Anaerolineaceae bacterium]